MEKLAAKATRGGRGEKGEKGEEAGKAADCSEERPTEDSSEDLLTSLLGTEQEERASWERAWESSGEPGIDTPVTARSVSCIS